MSSRRSSRSCRIETILQDPGLGRVASAKAESGPKKRGRVLGQPNTLSPPFPPLLVKNKGTEPEIPSVLLRHCDELCETKTVIWYSVRTSTKTILLRLAWV
ncbi:hypothetical protein BGY98DRAFT_1043830 [Russula aff. rugulosa BPL654]|nr:hypothetical protein BGY98DRAFT_1043830 [Russula aff. rugulosa BPL654]